MTGGDYTDIFFLETVIYDLFWIKKEEHINSL